MSATGGIQFLCFYFHFRVLFSSGKAVTMQGEGQLASWPRVNGEEKQATFLSLETAPVRVEEASLEAGPHCALLALALTVPFHDVQVRAVLAYQPWRCPALT